MEGYQGLGWLVNKSLYVTGEITISFPLNTVVLLILLLAAGGIFAQTVEVEKKPALPSKELWGEVTDLMICEEPDNLSVHDGNEYLGIDERTFLEPTIQSLIGACFAGAGQGRAIPNDWIRI